MDGTKHKKTWNLMDGAEHKETWNLLNGAEDMETWYLLDGAEHTRNCDELPESSRCAPVNLYF